MAIDPRNRISTETLRHLGQQGMDTTPLRELPPLRSWNERNAERRKRKRIDRFGTWFLGFVLAAGIVLTAMGEMTK